MDLSPDCILSCLQAGSQCQQFEIGFPCWDSQSRRHGLQVVEPRLRAARKAQGRLCGSAERPESISIYYIKLPAFIVEHEDAAEQLAASIVMRWRFLTDRSIAVADRPAPKPLSS